MTTPDDVNVVMTLRAWDMVTEQVPAEIALSPSNDPRSYRQNSDKLLATGFSPRYRVRDAIERVAAAYRAGELQDLERCYNIKAMQKIAGLN